MSSVDRKPERIFTAGKEHLKSGEIPSITVWGSTIPEAWETSVIATWENGTSIPTEYDQPVDPESRDCSATIVVTNPLGEPRIHRGFPDGLDGLYVYTQEVVEGVHDHWVADEAGWSYSYHDRLFNWPGVNNWVELPKVNQIDTIITKLAEVPHSRRSQAITWFPPADATHHEPPCLQRIWCRVVQSEQGLYFLEWNTHWRSRDALKAAFMNMFALTELQKKMAHQLTEVSEKLIEPGRYIEMIDSYHIYGSYVRSGDIERFLKRAEKGKLSDRVWRSDDPLVLEEFERGKQRLIQEANAK